MMAVGCGEVLVGSNGTGGSGGSGSGGSGGSGGGGGFGGSNTGTCAASLSNAAPTATGGVVAIAAGDQHACAVFGSGAVYCWGDNRLGQIGDGTDDNDRAQPVAARGISDAVDVALGVERSCAIGDAGHAICWGMLSHYGFDLLDPVSSDAPVCRNNMSDGAIVSGGSHHYCAVRDTGAVSCWGQNENGELGQLGEEWIRHPTPVPGLANAIDTAVGRDHSCALTNAGTVLCWGNNEYGQLGADLPMDGATPEPQLVVGITDATAIAAGEDHACAVRADGSVWCWGNGSGLAGLTDPSPVPIAIAGSEQRHRDRRRR